MYHVKVNLDLPNSTINTYDITFLCIIHENPYQEKARGHLGTELINKSSTALSINIEKDSKEWIGSWSTKMPYWGKGNLEKSKSKSYHEKWA